MLEILASLVHFQWGVIGMACLLGLMIVLVWWHTLLLRGRLAECEERLARLEEQGRRREGPPGLLAEADPTGDAEKLAWALEEWRQNGRVSAVGVVNRLCWLLDARRRRESEGKSNAH